MRYLYLIPLALVLFSVPVFASWCYQESANVTTQSGTDGNCGQIYNGTYYANDGWIFGGSATFDGNWESIDYAGVGEGRTGLVYVNYTIPLHATLSKPYWRVAYGWDYELVDKNITLSDSCWNYALLTNNLQLDYASRRYPYGDVYFACYNGTDWTTLDSYGDLPLREEAIWWESDLAPSVSLPYPADNSTNVNINTILTVDVNDTDSPYLNVTFFNASDNSTICYNETSANTTVNCYWETANDYITEYSWRVYVWDGYYNVSSSVFTFTTETEPTTTTTTTSTTTTTETTTTIAPTTTTTVPATTTTLIEAPTGDVLAGNGFVQVVVVLFLAFGFFLMLKSFGK